MRVQRLVPPSGPIAHLRRDGLRVRGTGTLDNVHGSPLEIQDNKVRAAPASPPVIGYFVLITDEALGRFGQIIQDGFLELLHDVLLSESRPLPRQSSRAPQPTLAA